MASRLGWSGGALCYSLPYDKLFIFSVFAECFPSKTISTIGLMVAELLLAVAGVIDGCIKLANKVITTYQSYRGADELVNERLVLVQALWTKLEIQLNFLKKISSQLDEELAQSHLDLLEILNGKLLQAVARLNVSTSSPSDDSTLNQKTSEVWRKWRFSLAKKGLDELVTELEAWRSRFDPTWYLIILMSSNTLDTALKETDTKTTESTSVCSSPSPLDSMLALRQAISSPKTSFSGESQPKTSLNLDAAGLRGATETPIPFSSARSIVRAGSNSLLIAESVNAPPGTISQVKVDVENLARRLQQVDPQTFGLLRCYGLLKHQDPATKGLKYIEVVYRAPQDANPPMTLRQLLLRHHPVSASAIVRTAKQLVYSISYIHTCDFVHKNIRPDNILVFSDANSSLGTSYLLGFNQFRSTHFQTNLLGDAAWHRNLYRHPERQGNLVQERYVMQHDIYSLGVCLLELGLWRSFVWYPDKSPSDTAAPVPGISLGLALSDSHFQKNNTGGDGRLKEHLVGMAKTILPSRLGDLYTDVVVRCLTCLDPENEVFGSQEQYLDEDGIVVGVRFIESILDKICQIVV
ncbi:hypothetical protein BN1723_001476 [Verticillium longisporum]|uniref:Protein kinase domain-containing protein n=1 Tax=Verticillium longisporum TaxID=100787 RepID=A0A0G4KET3_VERLO|nr:hypothetical protein BN1723_001476 [Verticillium longisporum]CRK38925.1 hypothetical protein BN1708_007903 [Verticillium longisporum]